MENTEFGKSNLPGCHVTKRLARTPHCSYFYATGLTQSFLHLAKVFLVGLMALCAGLSNAD